MPGGGKRRKLVEKCKQQKTKPSGKMNPWARKLDSVAPPRPDRQQKSAATEPRGASRYRKMRPGTQIHWISSGKGMALAVAENQFDENETR
jgi:hypothetical protein